MAKTSPLILGRLSPTMVSQAVEHEKVRLQGKALGLSEHQVDCVMARCYRDYQETPRATVQWYLAESKRRLIEIGSL